MFVRYTFSPGELIQIERNAEKECEDAINKIVSIKPSDRNFSNTIEAFEYAISNFNTAIGDITFMSHVSTDENIRKESVECETMSSKFLINLLFRKDLYYSIREYDPTMESLNDEQKRLLELTIRDFKRIGMDLPDEKIEELKRIGERLSELSTQFSSNLNENNDVVELTNDELDGTSDVYKERLKHDGNKYIVPLKATYIVPLMQTAKKSDTRKKVFLAANNIEAESNVPLLEEAIKLRYMRAAILGYSNHVDFATAHEMAKNFNIVKSFLNSVKENLRPRFKKEMENISRIKKEETGESKLEPWDVAYYWDKVKKKEYDIDNEKVKEYFRLDVVLEGMLNVYSRLLGITFHEVATKDVWAPAVKLYEIREGENIVAYFYMDLFPREGKYNHAAAFTLVSGRKEGNLYRKPVSAIVANFTAATPSRPSLLSHQEVTTFFHEFGHIMHQTLTKAPYSRISGSRTTRDFVEAPSQMLENWCWKEEVLQLISGHYTDTTKKLPNELLRKMVKSRYYDFGYFWTRQIFLATLDLVYHSSGADVDTTEICKKLYKEVLDLDVPDIRYQAAFGHLMGGYDAKYYSYIWSVALAEDMFTLFEREGLMSDKIGRLYKKKILERGYSVESDVLVKEFLGREPDYTRFLRIGLSDSLSE